MGMCSHTSGLYIVTEYVAAGDMRTLLKDKSKELPWPIRVRMAVDVSLAIFHLHSKGCIHRYRLLAVPGASGPSLANRISDRDLKSRNLLVDESYKVKLCDFGFSRQVLGAADAPMTVCGTTPWMVRATGDSLR
jgi:serine/threonine protein kinase